MESKIRSSERGQAVILMVLAVVVLLGFTALAVDGSMIYSDRRYTQTGADAAALAGGSAAAKYLEDNSLLSSSSGWTTATCGSSIGTAATSGKAAAVKRAADNSFVVTSGTANGANTVTAKCGSEALYATKASGGKVAIYNNVYMDLTTTVSRKTNTAFLHFVSKKAALNTVTAVSRVRPRQPLGYNYALVALNPNPCSGNSNGIQFRGNLKFVIEHGGNGGVFSNGCLDVDGGTQPSVAGNVFYFYGGNSLSNIQASGTKAQLADNMAARIPQDAYDIPIPDCTNRTFTQSDILGKKNLTGLYCIEGDFKMNNAADSFSGTNMSLVFLGGKVTMNGGTASIAAPKIAGYSGQAIPGVAIYMPTQYYGPTCGDVNQELKINGNSANVFKGTILAPCSDIYIEGGSQTGAYASQIIGYNVNSGGNADVYINWCGCEQGTRPASIDLLR